MLNEKFLTKLREAFPGFYAEVDAEARRDADELLRQAGGDVQQALVRARLAGAARVWVPYVRGSVPFVRDDVHAMKAFSKLVLTVDHVAGYRPESMEAARDQVVQVLRNSLDVERLRRLLDRDEKQAAQGAAAATAGAGLLASAGALMSPITAYRQARRWMRFVPAPMRVAAGAVVAAAVLSIPLVAGYSAGIQAEKDARTHETPRGGSGGGGSSGGQVGSGQGGTALASGNGTTGGQRTESRSATSASR